ncbi:MAG: hypothetical protein ACRBB0_25610 [Pelagimonas sp.]|uniref:hypothetical protein n=1 Tax=Pelagimonas sp. TaxID=2073170 RepID=UPI003D6B16B4
MNVPILSRDPEDLPQELPRGGQIPENLDPLADGILMVHQKTWLEDQSRLKVCEKGRRTGITFAEALDDTLIAAASRSAGGQNVFYIGDTKEKGREFIGYVAHFAKVVAGELAAIEEFVFEDQRDDGTTKHITAYRIKFNSGFRVEALSSNPANIRGLQGVVVIDEAAFHKDVREVIDAVNAMLIWGGRVRIISTHNGHLNPFNELIREARAKKNGYKVHCYTFGDAVKNGLYRRVCLMGGKDWSQEAQDEWEGTIRSAYGSRTSAMKQELDAVPSEMEGAALTRVQIENAQVQGVPFARWTMPDEFKNASETERQEKADAWCEEHLKGPLKALNAKRQHALGEDFARSGDATDILIVEIGADLVRRSVLLVEMRNIPFAQQKQVFFYVGDRLPRFIKGAVDKGGNGAYLAEEAAMRYGSVIVEVSFSRDWYAREMPPYIDAITDKTMLLPAHEDVLRDHQALQWDNGIVKVPQNFRFKGSDGLDRHGDTAIAGPLAYFASRLEGMEYEYEAAAQPSNDVHDTDDDEARDWWEPPLGTQMRGGII